MQRTYQSLGLVRKQEHEVRVKSFTKRDLRVVGLSPQRDGLNSTLLEEVSDQKLGCKMNIFYFQKCQYCLWSNIMITTNPCKFV